VPATTYTSVFASYRPAPRERLWPWTQLFRPDGSHADRSMLEASAMEVTVQKPAGGHDAHGGGRPVTVETSPRSAADPHAAHRQAPPASTAAASVDVPVPDGSDLVGIVQSIERESSRIEIRHGPIATLRMGGMTMWFPAKDAALLDQVKVGERFAFAIEVTDRGIVITRVERMAAK
jgi:Cu/Ag efflux protein CusF